MHARAHVYLSLFYLTCVSFVVFHSSWKGLCWRFCCSVCPAGFIKFFRRTLKKEGREERKLEQVKHDSQLYIPFLNFLPTKITYYAYTLVFSAVNVKFLWLQNFCRIRFFFGKILHKVVYFYLSAKAHPPTIIPLCALIFSLRMCYVFKKFDGKEQLWQHKIFESTIVWHAPMIFWRQFWS